MEFQTQFINHINFIGKISHHNQQIYLIFII